MPLISYVSYLESCVLVTIVGANSDLTLIAKSHSNCNTAEAFLCVKSFTVALAVFWQVIPV